MGTGESVSSARREKDLFIVDNSDSDWKVRSYLQEWTELAHKFGFAKGYFEVGALLALDDQWQKLEQFRILMGETIRLMVEIDKVIDAHGGWPGAFTTPGKRA